MPEDQELLLHEPGSLLPLHAIRAETALSRFPIHNLTKCEKIDIRIVERRDDGETDIYWSVSPSRDFGEPRQLAYKLDTLVVNRRIDEAGRPIPKVIRLGSLREICKELDLSGGKSASDIKTALQQNASAFITAKVSYRGNDGSEQRFEASFSRYGLRFYGQTLPDGKKADAVYIILNDEYWDLLNRAQFRPLNYDYLKELTPAAQRFYEILSFKMYAALSQGKKQARLLYSEYCTRAPLHRYTDGSAMRKQMHKIHQSHLKSAYIEGVEYRNVFDGAGQPDWELLYTPGSKARAEFLTFTKNHRFENRRRVEDSRESTVRQPEVPLLAELTKRGVSERQAQLLLKTLPEGQPVMDQLKWADQMVNSSGNKIRNPPGFYVHVLRENVPIASTPLRPERRMVAKDAPNPNTTDKKQEERLDLQIRDEIGNERFDELVEKKAALLRRQFGFMRPEVIHQVATTTVKNDLLKAK